MKSLLAVAVICGSCFIAGGCNLGMAPSGGSNEEVKANFDKLSLEDRANTIMKSPASMEFKKQRIKEMYEKEGKQPPADLFNNAGPGAAH